MKRLRVGCVEGFMESDGSRGERIGNIHFWHFCTAGLPGAKDWDVHVEIGTAGSQKYRHGGENFAPLNGRYFVHISRPETPEALGRARRAVRRWVQKGERP